jgi:hypothetical protein
MVKLSAILFVLLIQFSLSAESKKINKGFKEIFFAQIDSVNLLIKVVTYDSITKESDKKECIIQNDSLMFWNNILFNNVDTITKEEHFGLIGIWQNWIKIKLYRQKSKMEINMLNFGYNWYIITTVFNKQKYRLFLNQNATETILKHCNYLCVNSKINLR